MEEKSLNCSRSVFFFCLKNWYLHDLISLETNIFFVRIWWPQGISSKMEILYWSSSNLYSLTWLKKGISPFPQCIDILEFPNLGYSSIAKYKKNSRSYLKIKFQIKKALHRVRRRLRTGSRNMWFLNTVITPCWKFESAYFEQRLANFFAASGHQLRRSSNIFPPAAIVNGRNSEQLWCLPRSSNFLQ